MPIVKDVTLLSVFASSSHQGRAEGGDSLRCCSTWPNLAKRELPYELTTIIKFSQRLSLDYERKET